MSPLKNRAGSEDVVLGIDESRSFGIASNEYEYRLVHHNVKGHPQSLSGVIHKPPCPHKTMVSRHCSPTGLRVLGDASRHLGRISLKFNNESSDK